MKLIITIDTEEDDWGKYEATGHSVRNVEEIPEVQALFDQYDIKPTYLINYPVVMDARSVSIFGEILDQGRCEVGAHCHPWNTPPFSEITNERNSMLANLPADLQFSKIKILTEAIEEKLANRPTSFRSGRWGYSRDVANCLLMLGYKVDSSITPYVNWNQYYGPDYSRIGVDPFRYCSDRDEALNPSLLEIPVSIGYSGGAYEFKNAVYRFAGKPHLKKYHLIGLLHRLGLVRRIVLSPELHNKEQMITLSKSLESKGCEYAHLYFHSPTLKVGATEYVKDKLDKKKFLNNLTGYLDYASKAGYQPITLSEGHEYISQDCDTVRNFIWDA